MTKAKGKLDSTVQEIEAEVVDGPVQDGGVALADAQRAAYAGSGTAVPALGLSAIRTSATVTRLFAALAAVYRDLPVLVKEATNPFYKSKYADATSIDQSVRPLLAANGLFKMHCAHTLWGEPMLATRIAHVSGEWIEADVPLVIAATKGDVGPQDAGKSITYASRYGTLAILSASPANEDDDGNTGQGNTRPQARAATFREAVAQKDMACKGCGAPIISGESYYISPRGGAGCAACFEEATK